MRRRRCGRSFQALDWQHVFVLCIRHCTGRGFSNLQLFDRVFCRRPYHAVQDHRGWSRRSFDRIQRFHHRSTHHQQCARLSIALPAVIRQPSAAVHNSNFAALLSPLVAFHFCNFFIHFHAQQAGYLDSGAVIGASYWNLKNCCSPHWHRRRA